MSTKPRGDLAKFERRLGYRFRDRQFLEKALTHSSASGSGAVRDSERLEFLGDAVVELAISEALVRSYPEVSEGQLSRYRAALVKTASLAAMARRIGAGQWLRLGRGEEKTRGREKASILAATYEAVIAAVFCDGGFDAARTVVLHHFDAGITEVARLESPDPKTELQEICQAECRRAPTYHVTAQAGPAHARSYQVEARLGEITLGVGSGSSKRSAEQEAALQALRQSRAEIVALGRDRREAAPGGPRSPIP